MEWQDTPENRKAFVAAVARMVTNAGGVDQLVSSAVEAWNYVNDHLDVDPASLERSELEQAYINAMHCAWHLARLSYAVNGSLLDGGEVRRYNAALGGVAKAARDPKKAAREAGERIWPLASRKGWTATQFHRALTDAGYIIAFDTARKWLTSLRRSGKIQ